MLDINIEFRKGILFIRLNGTLDKFTMDGLEHINSLIIDNKVKNTVFNLDNLQSYDKKGVSKLYNIYINLIKHNLKCYFIKNNILNNMKIKKIDNELLAMEVLWN